VRAIAVSECAPGGGTMNRFWGHTLSVACLSVAAASAFPACAHNDGTFFVHNVLAPPTPSGGQCIYTPSPTSLFIPSGTVDAAVATSYSPVFLLANQMVPQGSPSLPAVESSRILVNSAIVQVVDPKTNATIENATVVTTSEIEPASGSSPSYALGAASIMDLAAITHFDPGAGSTGSNVALTYVQFVGETLGQQNVESNVYEFPVYVCHGCLVSVPATAQPGYCKGAVAQTSNAVACSTGQDQVTDCQNCANLAYCRSLGP
jgi:hypothetical protein